VVERHAHRHLLVAVEQQQGAVLRACERGDGAQGAREGWLQPGLQRQLGGEAGEGVELLALEGERVRQAGLLYGERDLGRQGAGERAALGAPGGVDGVAEQAQQADDLGGAQRQA
jgi:hypothetical protein